MSIKIKIPKEINEYEPKVAGPLTLRQLCIVLVLAPIIYLIYFKAKPVLGSTLALWLIFFPSVIGYVFGWTKPYGMKFEDFVSSAFISNVLSPKKRLYKSENIYETLHKQALLEESKANKVKKPKYKKSKQAIK